MHEMALAEGVLGIIESAQRAQHFHTVRVVRLEIGELAGVEVAALLSCLDIALRRSVAHAARIECAAAPGRGWCMDCARSVSIATLYASCPHCGGAQVQATDGLQMRVQDLMVE